MNTISEINKCLQHIFHYSIYPQQPTCIMSMKSYYKDIINFDHYNQFDNQLTQFEDLNNCDLNEPPFLDFQFEDDVVYQQDDPQNIEEYTNKSSQFDQFPSFPKNDEQSQVALIQLRNFRQSINKEIHIKQVPLDIFTRQLTPKRSIPSLFDEVQHDEIKQNQQINYKPLRERIQEKLSQKKIETKERKEQQQQQQQQYQQQQQQQQVINNRFSKATQNSASRYHSKSPQSQFTKEFKQKFNQINPSQILQSNQKQQNPDQLISPQRQNSNIKTSLTPQKILADSTLKIRIDIQNFQENHKKQSNKKQEKENKSLTPLKSQSKINSQDFDIKTKVKKQIINQRSRNPINLSKSPSKTPEKEQCKYVVVNFYQKKY